MRSLASSGASWPRNSRTPEKEENDRRENDHDLPHEDMDEVEDPRMVLADPDQRSQAQDVHDLNECQAGQYSEKSFLDRHRKCAHGRDEDQCRFDAIAS